jgi:outer membrane lipoprotein SlyB
MTNSLESFDLGRAKYVLDCACKVAALLNPNEGVRWMAENNDRNQNGAGGRNNSAGGNMMKNMPGNAGEAAGTVGGAVVGGVVGSVAGPLGTAAGAVAGGALGNQMGENLGGDNKNAKNGEQNKQR